MHLSSVTLSSRLTKWSRDLLQKLTVAQLDKKFTGFYRTQRFITIFTKVCHWSLTWTKWIQFTPNYRYFFMIHFNIILSSMSRRSKWYFHPNSFGKNFVSILLSSHACYMPPLIHLDLTALITLGDKHKFLCSSLCNFLHPPVTSSLLDPNIPLSTLFSNTLGPCPPLYDEQCVGNTGPPLYFTAHVPSAAIAITTWPTPRMHW
jgi:hypothetical protein